MSVLLRCGATIVAAFAPRTVPVADPRHGSRTKFHGPTPVTLRVRIAAEHGCAHLSHLWARRPVFDPESSDPMVSTGARAHQQSGDDVVTWGHAAGGRLDRAPPPWPERRHLGALAAIVPFLFQPHRAPHPGGGTAHG